MDSTFTCHLLPFLVDDTNHIFLPNHPTRARCLLEVRPVGDGNAIAPQHNED
ncbi:MULTISPECIES: hypothetical protein [unclassified Coleofasciculus]|uniref:hypothetical protein n=1 Tax=unclassified Coleofasciculus TaxID=2692782 RepID=UPI00187EB1A8|nr:MULTISPECIES: hypothetical protein [unclassified Coleofasciculus]MBE9127932.1 hypothetical protein [Coleofasciculus sp. LEGE 07081]MBE9150644.1 hypothetical protein [Coleofasciculus sp. LEGE 07092]